jgi:hypothetical protein
MNPLLMFVFLYVELYALNINSRTGHFRQTTWFRLLHNVAEPQRTMMRLRPRFLFLISIANIKKYSTVHIYVAPAQAPLQKSAKIEHLYTKFLKSRTCA